MSNVYRNMADNAHHWVPSGLEDFLDKNGFGSGKEQEAVDTAIEAGMLEQIFYNALAKGNDHGSLFYHLEKDLIDFMEEKEKDKKHDDDLFSGDDGDYGNDDVKPPTTIKITTTVEIVSTESTESESTESADDGVDDGELEGGILCGGGGGGITQVNEDIWPMKEVDDLSNENDDSVSGEEKMDSVSGEEKMDNDTEVGGDKAGGNETTDNNSAETNDNNKGGATDGTDTNTGGTNVTNDTGTNDTGTFTVTTTTTTTTTTNATSTKKSGGGKKRKVARFPPRALSFVFSDHDRRWHWMLSMCAAFSLWSLCA